FKPFNRSNRNTNQIESTEDVEPHSGQEELSHNVFTSDQYNKLLTLLIQIKLLYPLLKLVLNIIHFKLMPYL
ncbi:conserved hypothetical protein, partial [Ricinus communis]